MTRKQLSNRYGLKKVVKFAKKEYREKRPLTCRVLRVKEEKKVSLGGPLPQRAVKESHNDYYAILLDYGEIFRVYTFSKSGMLINGQNIEKGSDKIKSLEKLTNLEYKL